MKEDTEKISIIIPVYKVERYLSKCIQSVIKQTYSNLEILLIDDGSPDACGEICDQYAKKDSRIRVIHKKNEGVALARNSGLDAATGEYISFIDSDDWIARDAYQNLYDGLKKYHADCAIGRCVKIIDRDGVLKKRTEPIQPVRCTSSYGALKHTLLNSSAIWNRLFKKEVFEQLRFPAGRINDDEVVALRAYAKCRRIVYLNQDSYFYRIRPESITTSKFSLRQMDYYYNSRENLAFIRKYRPELAECGEFKYYKAILYCYFHLLGMWNETDAKKNRQMLIRDIRKGCKSACKNRYVTMPMKAAMMFLALF